MSNEDVYVILSAHKKTLLENNVINYIKQGWVCSGSVSMCAAPYNGIDDNKIMLWAQAMVKPTSETKGSTTL
jgi:hypothetical protein